MAAKCWPARKDDLVHRAEQNDADQDILDVLRQMPDTEYLSMADVLKGVGKVE